LYGTHRKEFLLQHVKTQKHAKNLFYNGKQPLSDNQKKNVLSKHHTAFHMQQSGTQIKFIVV
jgi:hypothetical protein